MKLLAAVAALLLAALASSAASSSAASRGEETASPTVPGPGVAESASQGPIVAFGDSYTAGYGAAAGESYPDVLAASLGTPVINRGVSGQTAAEALPRLQAEVIDLRPRLVIVEFGANEAFRGQPIATCVDALEAILRELRLHGIPVLLVGVHAAAFQADFDDALRALAARHGAALVLDVLAGTLDDVRYVAADGHHPNGLGYSIMESRIRPYAELLVLDPGLGFAPEGAWSGPSEGMRRA